MTNVRVGGAGGPGAGFAGARATFGLAGLALGAWRRLVFRGAAGAGVASGGGSTTS